MNDNFKFFFGGKQIRICEVNTTTSYEKIKKISKKKGLYSRFIAESPDRNELLTTQRAGRSLPRT